VYLKRYFEHGRLKWYVDDNLQIRCGYGSSTRYTTPEPYNFYTAPGIQDEKEIEKTRGIDEVKDGGANGCRQWHIKSRDIRKIIDTLRSEAKFVLENK
jgi:hypothetical protein